MEYTAASDKFPFQCEIRTEKFSIEDSFTWKNCLRILCYLSVLTSFIIKNE